MISIGLLIFGITQVGTGITILFSNKKSHFIGVPTLKQSYSVYRYLLAGLWFSVSTIYLLGAFLEDFTKAAIVLAFINGLLEVGGYFLGVRHGGAKWFPYAGTIWIGVQLLLILFI